MSVSLNQMAKLFLPAEVSDSTHLDGTADLDPKAEFPTKLNANAQNFVPLNVNSQIATSPIPGNVFVPSTKNSGES